MEIHDLHEKWYPQNWILFYTSPGVEWCITTIVLLLIAHQLF